MATSAVEHNLPIEHTPPIGRDGEAAAVELNDNILLRFNREEKRAIGLTLMGFSVLVHLTELGPRSFSLSGLADLEPGWQEHPR